MPVATILTVLIAAGLVLYLFGKYVPMSRKTEMFLRLAVVLSLCVFLLNSFGIIHIPMQLK